MKKIVPYVTYSEANNQYIMFAIFLYHVPHFLQSIIPTFGLSIDTI